MKYQVIIRPEAEADLHSAFQWYEKQEDGLGAEFLRCVEASIFSIDRSPKMFSVVYSSI